MVTSLGFCWRISRSVTGLGFTGLGYDSMGRNSIPTALLSGPGDEERKEISLDHPRIA